MSSVTATDEFREILLKTLQQAKEPLSALQISKQLTGPAKKPREEVEAALEEFVETGAVHRLPKFNRQVRYWCKPLKYYIDLELLKALSDQPQTKSKVRSSIKAKLKDVKPAEIDKHIDELVRQGKLQKWPTALGARTAFFCVRSVEADFYVEHALGKIMEKLKKEGIGKAELRQAARKVTDGWTEANSSAPCAPPPGDVPSVDLAVAGVEPPAEPALEELILERMSVVEPRADEGALVSIAELRNSLEFQPIPKQDFDAAVLRLRSQWRASLAEHPHISALPADELKKLVYDGQGHYFNGIAFRERTES